MLLVQQKQNLHGKYLEYIPTPFLKPFVKKYYFIEGFKYFAGHCVKAIGKENVEIHFHYGEKGHEVSDLKDELFKLRRAYVVGNYPMDKLCCSRIINDMSMLSVELTTLGLNCLLNIFPSEIFNSLIDIEDFYGNNGKILTERIINSEGFEKKLELIENFFKRVLRKEYLPGRKDKPLLQFIDNRPGSSVINMCKQLNVNRRYIERFFSKRIGVSPKEYLRIVRFNKACELLGQYPEISTIEIIHKCHYYDQSHFIREFKMLAEMSPLKYLKQINGMFYLGRGYIL